MSHLGKKKKKINSTYLTSKYSSVETVPPKCLGIFQAQFIFKHPKPFKYVLLPRSGPKGTDSVDRERHKMIGESASFAVLRRRADES